MAAIRKFCFAFGFVLISNDGRMDLCDGDVRDLGLEVLSSNIDRNMGILTGF